MDDMTPRCMPDGTMTCATRSCHSNLSVCIPRSTGANFGLSLALASAGARHIDARRPTNTTSAERASIKHSSNQNDVMQ
eukprot:7996642-Karenia_brevis.AAC.1